MALCSVGLGCLKLFFAHLASEDSLGAPYKDPLMPPPPSPLVPSSLYPLAHSSEVFSVSPGKFWLV